MTTSEKVWTCKIGGHSCDLPSGANGPMRKAVERAYRELTEQESEFTFSGWGGSLTEGERAVVENRRPSDRHRDAWRILRKLATDMKQRDGEQWAAGDLLEELLGIKEIEKTDAMLAEREKSQS